MKELIEYFKCALVQENQKSQYVNTSFLNYGFLLDFSPSAGQIRALESFIRNTKVKTLFSVEEVQHSDTYAKIVKQISSYIASYWFDRPELYVSVDDFPFTFVAIHGVTKVELQALVDNILYSNRPAKDIDVLVKIIKECGLSYKLNQVLNNELRIHLFDEKTDSFASGDDVVRYIVFKCTENSLLIKSPEVVSQVTSNGKNVSNSFLRDHSILLSQCFNRHKRIIMALKIGTKDTTRRAIINRITRLSKQTHVPIHQPKSKTFIADAFSNNENYEYGVLTTFSLRDKLKLLNLLGYKKERLKSDIFVIRNGKTWVETDRPVYRLADIDYAENKLLAILAQDLRFLQEKTIYIPPNVDYGLPISRKQSLGNLPFGTKIRITEGAISSGIYWENDWGAFDLDLSSIDITGNRIGWGGRAAYTAGDINFSGDLVDALKGAMEFITSRESDYGLYVNIFNGKIGCKAELVIGNQIEGKWIKNCVIREKFQLDSRGNVMGFVDGTQFTVFQGRLNYRIANFSSDGSMFQKIHAYKWTIKTLLRKLDIPFEQAVSAKPDHDLSYEKFTYDKLEALFRT